MTMNYNGTIHADKIYTENEMRHILNVSTAQMIEYYRDGLLFYQRSRQQERQISGAEYHRFIERNLQSWPSDDENAVPA